MKKNSKKNSKKNKGEKGQAIFEYVLLLGISFLVVYIIIEALVVQNPDNPEESGIFVKKWYEIIRFVEEDQPEVPSGP